MKAGIVFLIAIAAAQAQVYPYPGGYPGGYPGQYPTGPTIPLPRRTKQTKPKDSKDSRSNVPLPNFRGMLKQMDDKTITLQLDDNRILDFQRTDKTKFFKDGEELKSPTFKPGDQISVEGQQEEAGYYSAVNVYWEKAAGAKSGDAGGKVPDTWKDAPKDAPKDTAAAAGQERSTDMKPPAAKADPSDPGPPVMRRGKPANPAREKSDPLPPGTASNSAPARDTETVRPPAPAMASPEPGTAVSEPSIVRSDDEARIARHASDPLIRKAVEASMDFTETLPAYVCQEMISRFQSETSPANWHALDIVTTNVVYENGKEDYRDIAVNGKPVKKKMEELGGAWSTGEFGTVLVDVLSPATAADFRFRRDSRIAGMNTKQYDFSVKRENSHWVIHMGGQRYSPAYDGRIWIEPSTGRVLRIEMDAKGFPDEFPSDHVESATDYQYVRLGDLKQYLLPVHAETLSCQRGSNFCARNTIDFRNYKKYAGESTIEYTDVNSTVKFDDKAKTDEKKK